MWWLVWKVVVVRRCNGGERTGGNLINVNKVENKAYEEAKESGLI